MDNKIVLFTIVVYILVLVAIGVVSGKKSKSIADFTVGGRSAGAWLSALSYGTAYFSAVMFVGYAGKTGLNFGLWGILAGIGNAVFGSFLAWAVLARRTREISKRLNVKTMPDLFAKRYHSSKMKTFSAIICFIFLIPYSASVYSGLASVAKVLLGIEDTIFLIIIALLSIALVTMGGYLVQARADFVQGIVMMIGVVLLLVGIVRCDRVGGVEHLLQYAKSSQGLPHLSISQWISLMATVLMTSFGTWGLPQMVQKFFGIKDDKEAKKGIVISTLFAFLIAGGGYFIGGLCHMFFTVGIDMPTADYIVPSMLKVANLSSVLLGIIIVLLLSASVSTLCSITLSASATLTMDLIVPKFKPNMKDIQMTKLNKICCILFIVLSYVVANTKTPILDLMSYSWGIISGSFLAPYLLALYNRNVTKKAAWSGMLSGFCIAIVPAACKLFTQIGIQNGMVSLLAMQGPLFACIAMVLSFTATILVTSVSKAKSSKKEVEFFYNGIVEQE